MKSWSKRPSEIANLINPAFCGLILREFTRNYLKKSGKAVDYPLLFIAAPLVLQSDTRKALPSTVATKHHAWLEKNQALRLEFAERCRALVPYIKEAIVFSCQHKLIEITQEGEVSVPQKHIPRLPWPAPSETLACLTAAGFVGRWLANAGPTSTIFTLWGLRP